MRVDPQACSATWDDPRFGRLSKPAPNAQTLWLYLVSGPFATAIPGVVRGGRAAIAETLGWSVEDFDSIFAELVRAEIARADWNQRLVYVRNAFSARNCRPGSPNVVLRWRRALDELPDCELREEIAQDLRSLLLEISPAFLRAFDCNRRAVGSDRSTVDRSGKAARIGSRDSQTAEACVEVRPKPPEPGSGPDENGDPAANPDGARSGRRLLKRDPEETRDLPPIPPLRESSPRGQGELVPNADEGASLGEPQTTRQRRTVERWLEESLAVFAELSAARRRVDRSLPELRPTYESLAGIAGRLDAGKTLQECRYVVAVCEAECRRDRGALRYFNAISPFRPENFEMKLAMPLDLPPPRAERSERAPPESARVQPESIEIVLSRRREE